MVEIGISGVIATSGAKLLLPVWIWNSELISGRGYVVFGEADGNVGEVVAVLGEVDAGLVQVDVVLEKQI